MMPAKSKAQQSAAALALQAKEGDIPASKLRGASKGMYKSMTKEELRDYAETDRADLPEEKGEGVEGEYTVDEDVNIQLDDETYLLEKGDKITIVPGE
jgi:molybdopterin converting factor small subunit